MIKEIWYIKVAKGLVTADLHMHCAASEDSETPIESLFDIALQKGLSMIAVTDHVELVDFRGGAYDVAMRESRRMMDEAQPPSSLTLLHGIELGEPAFDTALADEILASYSYDFVLASQHRLSDALPDYYYIDFSDWPCERIVEEMRRYFEELLRVAEWNGFDSLAHLTYPFRYLPACWRNGDYSPWETVIDRIFETLIQNGKSLEINTSGLRKGQGMTAPDEPLVQRYYALGGRRITIGSDAHRAHEVGANLDDAWRMAANIGFKTLTVYKQRKPFAISVATL